MKFGSNPPDARQRRQETAFSVHPLTDSLDSQTAGTRSNFPAFWETHAGTVENVVFSCKFAFYDDGMMTRLKDDVWLL